MTATTRPPFRADHVGSFLRTATLKEARAKRDRGEITPAQLRAVEDQEIEKLIRQQEEVGLKVATDGEFRRAWWHYDFFAGLDGTEIGVFGSTFKFQGMPASNRGIRITGKIGFPDAHPFIEDFKVVKSWARVTPKITIPAPSVFHFRLEPNSLMTNAYADRDAIFDDVAATYRKAVKAFYDAGCRYLQFDDTCWGYLCSPEEMAKAKTRGINTEKLAERYAALINASMADKPKDMAITTHVCRGNFRSTWIASGGYEPVAEVMFGTTYDGYFLEYDTDRAGGFEPLRFLRKGNQRVVLGLVSSKIGALEKKDDIKQRIDEAAKFAPLDQLCLSPQCGFASTQEGNILSEDEQWAKMRQIVEIADEVWD